MFERQPRGAAGRGCLRRWRWALLLGLGLGLASGRAAPPAAQSRAQPSPHAVLVLSALSQVQDRNVMATLQQELHGAQWPQGFLLERVELDSDGPEAHQQAQIAQALARRRWGLIVVTTGAVSSQVLALEKSRPVLFRTAAHPANSCLVQSLRRPGANATGYSSYLFSDAKMVEALVRSYPQIENLVVLHASDGSENSPCEALNPPEPAPCQAGLSSTPPDWESQVLLSSHARGARRSMSFLRLCSRADLAQLGKWLKPLRAPGLVVPYSDFFYNEAAHVVATIGQLKIPAVYRDRNAIPLGGLLTVAPLRELPGKARGIEQVRRLLAGVPPGEIPVQLPEGFEITLNLTTARSLGKAPSKAALRAVDHLVR